MPSSELLQLYSFFYAVMYGSMLASLGGLKPFPWGFWAEEDGEYRKCLAWRLLVSFPLLNLSPIALFAWGYLELRGRAPTSAPEFADIFLVGTASLAVFAPYRLYALLIVSLRGRVDLYSKEERESIQRVKDIRPSAIGHALAIIVYALPLLGMIYWE